MQKVGVFWKIHDICYQMGTEIFKIEEEMTEKMKHKVANPPSKNGQNSLLTICSPLMSLCIFMTCNESKTCSICWKKVKQKQFCNLCLMCQVQGPLYPREWLRGSMSVNCEQRILTIFGGGVGNFMLHFLSHFFFNIENLSAHVVANILNFPIHPQHLHFG